MSDTITNPPINITLTPAECEAIAEAAALLNKHDVPNGHPISLKLADLGYRLEDLIADVRTVAPVEMHSFNENLESELDASSQVWDGVLTHFDGFAERKGDTLVFTDPNGTKPYSPQAIVEVIGKPLPPIYGDISSPNIQLQALNSWVADSSEITSHTERDLSQDMRRLVDRITPSKIEVLYRGMSFDNEAAAEKYLNSLSMNDGHIALNFYESFSKKRETAEFFSKMNAKEMSVIIELRNSKGGKDISYLINRYESRFSREAEVLMPKGTKFREISRKLKTDGGKKILHLVVEEVK